ncbi:TPA: hypothetical protein JBC15_15225 [Legionella pneumophila subsp. pneumophila]|uniref:Uncharacterized protein n=1 Tax=Legionella cardiaca TaxID=1071983 RepID=A0ABY8AVE7_9GAMM|nr:MULTISPECIES: hypothetical protein [Legionella]HAT9215391.1 hypothetical protein [Legionella pneumophila subsp. pneumophila]WED43386.1 hypothetical protein PXX05_01010 [Legionella cardiaca]CZJ13821.1 Uncharacterised protein [Legionella pneumophila]HAT9262347.1 hypothetical protein [Legionella pneumophila subsp. pneumophila]HAT9283605.1 hypothetical protein [Legionella pneumophila subsp. pneumophila]
MRRKLASIMGIFFFIPFAYSFGLDDVYVQEKNKIISFKQAVTSKQGYVGKKNNHYFLSIGSYSTTFDLNGNINSFDSATNILFPKRVFMELTLMNLYPNAQIYFDQEPIGNTDQDGNARKVLYLEKIGSYSIKIKKPKNKVAHQVVKIEDTCKVECRDVKPMTCNIFTEN